MITKQTRLEKYYDLWWFSGKTNTPTEYRRVYHYMWCHLFTKKKKNIKLVLILSAYEHLIK